MVLHGTFNVLRILLYASPDRFLLTNEIPGTLRELFRRCEENPTETAGPYLVLIRIIAVTTSEHVVECDQYPLYMYIFFPSPIFTFLNE